jgi:AcrR family transcriptional regulator
MFANPSNGATTTQTRPSPNLRAARILDAASHCFSEKGFQGTTIIDVANAAGVSRPLIYKYFGDKDGLVDALLGVTFTEWERLNLEPTSLRDSTSPPAASGIAQRALGGKIMNAIEFVRDRPIFRSILQQDPQIIMRGHMDGLRNCRSVSAERTAAILRSGIKSGEFRDNLDEAATTHSLEMILFGLLERALGIRPDLSLDPALTRSTIDLVLAGLRANESSA